MIDSAKPLTFEQIGSSMVFDSETQGTPEIRNSELTAIKATLGRHTIEPRGTEDVIDNEDSDSSSEGDLVSTAE